MEFLLKTLNRLKNKNREEIVNDSDVETTNSTRKQTTSTTLMVNSTTINISTSSNYTKESNSSSEQTLNLCSYLPSESYCRNGGTCHSENLFYFTCECPDGFEGQTCEITVSNDTLLNNITVNPTNLIIITNKELNSTNNYDYRTSPFLATNSTFLTTLNTSIHFYNTTSSYTNLTTPIIMTYNSTEEILNTTKLLLTSDFITLEAINQTLLNSYNQTSHFHNNSESKTKAFETSTILIDTISDKNRSTSEQLPNSNKSNLYDFDNSTYMTTPENNASTSFNFTTLKLSTQINLNQTYMLINDTNINETIAMMYGADVMKNETENYTVEKLNDNINTIASNESTIVDNDDNFDSYDVTYESSSSELNNNSTENENDFYTNDNNNYTTKSAESQQSTSTFNSEKKENTTTTMFKNNSSDVFKNTELNFTTIEELKEQITTSNYKEQNEMNQFSTTNPILATMFPLKYKSSLDESCKRRACSELEFKYCYKFNNASCKINDNNEPECVCISTYKGKYCEERYSFCINIRNIQEPVCKNGGF